MQNSLCAVELSAVHAREQDPSFPPVPRHVPCSPHLGKGRVGGADQGKPVYALGCKRTGTIRRR